MLATNVTKDARTEKSRRMRCPEADDRKAILARIGEKISRR
jgi:hypothetical protein